MSDSIAIEDSSVDAFTLSEKVLMLNPYNKTARLNKLYAKNSTNLTHELELFLKYEPAYSSIDTFKISYVSNLLKALDNTNVSEICKKINIITYSTSSLNQYSFKNSLRDILDLIKEKNALYPSAELDDLYNTYFTFSSY